MDAVRSGWWSMGPRVGELERAFAQHCGARHALAVTNGTAALHLALLAAGCAAGDEVLLTSLNFVAAANTIRHTGPIPVFCDITGVDDLNVSPDDIEAAIGPRTRALVVMHYGGHPCRMDAILELATRHGLALVEDAAHAPGAEWRGQRCGTFGDVGCFSFFSNKNLPVGEGGMIVTDDDALAERIGLLRSHGMTTLTWDRHRGHASSYDVVSEGFNYRSTSSAQRSRSFSSGASSTRMPNAHGSSTCTAARSTDGTDCGSPSSRRPTSISATILRCSFYPRAPTATSFARRSGSDGFRRACTTRQFISSPPIGTSRRGAPCP